jgi:2-polyprenyl-3-methyl-5-hydroxy-6-metoxy-1,4-benzoquinol methylase
MDKKSATCKICGNEDKNDFYTVNEMMFGLRDSFSYFQCNRCKCLQIETIPADLSKYYPSNYYSFREEKNPSPLRKRLIHLRNKYAVFNSGVLGKLVYYFFPYEKLRGLSQINNLDTKSKVLDVGCGSGYLLKDLKSLGFKNLTGIDPFLSDKLVTLNEIDLQKKSIFEVNEKWDLVMFHHVFEHVKEQSETLAKVFSLLNENGKCLIRIPTVSSFAWKEYKENWVQLDAPRHLFLHSLESIKILAEKNKLKIESLEFDSTEFQLWGSEQYKRNIPLTDKKSYSQSPKNSIFSFWDMYRYKKIAKKLNRKSEGDSIAIVLSK